MKLSCDFTHSNLQPDSWRLVAKGLRSRPKDRERFMSNTSVLITDMAILVAIFLLGLLAKLFPKNGRNAGSKR